MCGRVSMEATTVGRVPAAVNEALLHSCGQITESLKIFVIAFPFPCEHDPQSMVKIVVPLTVESVSADGRRIDNFRIVQAAFGNHDNLPVQRLGLHVNGIADFLQNMPGAEADDSLNGIKPKGIDMVCGHPIESIADEIMPDMVAVGPIEVDGGPPRCAIAVREIGTEVAKIISLGAKVVVDDVEHHSHARGMAAIDQP